MPKIHPTRNSYPVGYSDSAESHPYRRNNGRQPGDDNTTTPYSNHEIGPLDLSNPHSNHEIEPLDLSDEELNIIRRIESVDNQGFNKKECEDIFPFIVKSRVEFIKKLSRFREFSQGMFDYHFFIELSKVRNTEVLRWFLDDYSSQVEINITALFNEAMLEQQWPMMCICMAYEDKIKQWPIDSCLHYKYATDYTDSAVHSCSRAAEDKIIGLINEKFSEKIPEISDFAASSSLEFIKEISTLKEFNTGIFDNSFFLKLGTSWNFEVLHWFLKGSSCLGKIDIDSLFHAAISKNQWLMMCICIAYGASMGPRPSLGNTPLHLSASTSTSKTIQFLFHRNPDALSIKNNPENKSFHGQIFDGNCPVHLASMLPNNTEPIRCLIKLGADLRMQNNNGDTPLHLAVDAGNIETINELCINGADLEIKNFRGYTPLHEASSRNKLNVIEVLCEHGANSNAETNNGDKPLHLLIQSNDKKLNDKRKAVKILRKSGADINGKNALGNTPFHVAILLDEDEDEDGMIKYLFIMGASLDAKNGLGLMPEDYAKRQVMKDILAKLKELVDATPKTLPSRNDA